MLRALVRSRSVVSTPPAPAAFAVLTRQGGRTSCPAPSGLDASRRDGGFSPVEETCLPATTRCEEVPHGQAATDALASLRLSPALSGRHRPCVWDKGAPRARPPWLRCTAQARLRASPIRPGVHTRMTRVERGADLQGCHGGVPSTCPLPPANRAGLPTGKGRRLENRGPPGRRIAGCGQFLTPDEG